jgi:hypothetical protein
MGPLPSHRYAMLAGDDRGSGCHAWPFDKLAADILEALGESRESEARKNSLLFAGYCAKSKNTY